MERFQVEPAHALRVQLVLEGVRVQVPPSAWIETEGTRRSARRSRTITSTMTTMVRRSVSLSIMRNWGVLNFKFYEG